MIALAVAGIAVCVLLLALTAGAVLAVRQRRVKRQPPVLRYYPHAPARRHADLRRHPADEETQEIPTIQEDDQ